MSFYVFFNSDAQDNEVLTAAKNAARSRGATVVKSLAGTMLLELAGVQVPEVAQPLPGWRYSIERKTARVPERKPLARAKARGALAAAAIARSGLDQGLGPVGEAAGRTLWCNPE